MAASDPGARPPTPGSSVAKPPIEPAEKWADTSFMVTFAFRCNIACTFCMVEDVLDVLEGTSLEELRRLAAEPAPLQRKKRIIFSGGEVTLAKDLPRYAEVARSIPGIEHVRIQTNATRLANRAYLRTLLDAGIDEYFVSIHAPDAALCDAITQRPGSFDLIVEGMRAIREAGATLITNTAIALANFDRLPEIVELVAPLGPRSIEIWNYWPRADEDGARQHTARVADIRPHLLAALRASVARGIPPVVKWFPRCLLGARAGCPAAGQPPALIADSYWEREPGYGCVYAGACRDAGPCAGLSDTYVARYGWEETLLEPRRKLASTAGLLPRGDVRHSLLADAGPARSDQAAIAAWLGKLELALGARFGGFELASAAKIAGQGLVALTFTRGADSAGVRVGATDPERRCFARTKSFDVFYARVDPALERDVAALVEELVAHVGRRDRGDLGLP